jgi:hypothetical protein
VIASENKSALDYGFPLKIKENLAKKCASTKMTLVHMKQEVLPMKKVTVRDSYRARSTEKMKIP